MPAVKWIKLTTDIFDDEKILMIETLPSADTIIVIWFKLLTFAGKSNNNGVFMMNNRIAYTDEMLAAVFRRDVKIVQVALKTFESFGMIEIVDDVITIPNWGKHQNVDGMEKIREQNRERKRLQRERQRQALIDDVSRDSHGTVTECHDIEEEREEDEEKEIHSFNLSEADKKRIQQEYIGGTLGQGVVMLSEEQFDSLLDELSLDEFHKYIGIVAECEKNGKKFKKKTHYQAILDMVAKDRKVGRP